jgi:hypothetical protein
LKKVPVFQFPRGAGSGRVQGRIVFFLKKINVFSLPFRPGMQKVGPGIPARGI